MRSVRMAACARSPSTFGVTAMAKPPDHQREQARVRQARHRDHARADRIELQAATEAAKLPLAWRPEFLDVVRVERVRAHKALAQVERAALKFPEGEARKAYLRRNYTHTKVSVTRLLSRFVGGKKNLAEAELYRDIEDDRAHDDLRPDIEHIDWDDLEAVSSVLDDPADFELAAAQPTARFIASILLAGIYSGNTLAGFAQAIELFRFLDAARMRQVDTDEA